MFDGLKKRLKGFTKDIDDTVQKKEVGIADKAKALILDRQVILDEKDLEKPLWELEVALLENDVALSVAEEIVVCVKEELIGEKKGRGTKTDQIAKKALKDALLKVLSVSDLDFDSFVKSAEKPVNIVFIGVNGAGKTTCIAKIAKRLMEKDYSVVIASADTYRAGATEQIEEHAQNLGLKLIKHQQGADPAAVVYDAVNYARARRKDVILSDTAGRLHTNINLMDQLKKICRVTDPDLVLFVDEAIAGNDAVERAKQFNDVIRIDGTILTKMDADAKGGAAISIAHCIGKPILFVGTGQQYNDLKKFNPQWLVDNLVGS